MTANELIFACHWEAPCDVSTLIKRCSGLEYTGLYVVYGFHAVYGDNVPLYIGMSKDIESRLKKHAAWIEDQVGPVTVQLGLIYKFESWEQYQNTNEGGFIRDDKVISQIESLQIYCHSTAYNSKDINHSLVRGIRVFNTGHSYKLLKEISSLRMLEG